MLIPAMLLGGASGSAHAHAILVRSEPSANSAVSAGEKILELQFNSRVDAARSRLTLIRTNQGQSVLAILPGIAENTLSARVTLSPGAYIVHWQVLAVDGHITRGDLPFTVADH